MSLFEQLPSTWIETTLGDISIDIRYGLTARAEGDTEGVFYLRISDINDYGEVKLTDRKFVKLSEDIEKYILKPGDIVVARSGSVGRSYVYTGSSAPWVFASYLIRFRVNQAIADPNYVGFYLRSPFFWQYVDTMARTVAQPNINSQELSKLPIPLPTLPEQHLIVDILRQADGLRLLRQEGVARFQMLGHSIFSTMFSAYWDTGPFVKLEDIADIVSGVIKGRRFNGRETIDVPYLRVANVQAGYLDLSEIKTIEALPEDLERYRLEFEDVLLTEGGDYDKLGRGALWENQVPDCIHQNHIFRVRLDQNRLLPRFFVTYLQTSYAREYFLRSAKRTTNLASINMAQLRKLPVLVPPMELQSEFVARLGSAENVIRNQVTSADSLLVLLRSLLYFAFQGKLTSTWHNNRADELQNIAVQRDIALGLRGEEPTIGDYEAGRVTQAEREEIERQLTESMRPMVEQLSKSFQPVGESLRAFQQHWADQMAALIQPIRLPTIELQPIFSDVFRDVLLRQQEQFASIAESYRNMVANIAATIETSAKDYMDLANNIVNWLEEWPPTNHPRYDLVSNFNRQQKFILIICEQQEAFFTVETIQEKLGTSADAVRRNLELFASLGLIAKVTLPAQSSAGITYTPAYRYLNEDDEVRLLDLTLLEEKNPV
jgi:type I restriction enzyme S subunit